MANVAAALGLDVRAHGDDVASRHLTALAKAGEDPRPAFRQIQEEIRTAEATWFGTRGEGSWPNLQQATLDAKLRRGQPPDPLVATGALRRSLTVKRGSGAIRSATKRQMKFGSKVYYGRFHERGGRVPVRRPLLPVDTRTRRRMVKDVREWLMGATRGRTPQGRSTS